MESLEINFTITSRDFTFIHEDDIKEQYYAALEAHPAFNKDEMIDYIVDNILDNVMEYAYDEFGGGDVEVDDTDRYELYDVVYNWVNEHWDLDNHEIMVDGQLLLFDPDNMPK